MLAGVGPPVCRFRAPRPPRSPTCVARLAREGHQRVLVQLPRLVVGRLEDGRAAHRSLGGRDQGEVLARDTEENLPGNEVSEASMLKGFCGGTYMLPVSVCSGGCGWGIGVAKLWSALLPWCWSFRQAGGNAHLELQPERTDTAHQRPAGPTRGLGGPAGVLHPGLVQPQPTGWSGAETVAARGRRWLLHRSNPTFFRAL